MNRSILSVLGVLVLTTAHASVQEKVTCVDQKQDWKVKFDLDGQQAKHMAFINQGKLKRSIESIPAQVNHTQDSSYYDFALGEQKFLNFKKGNVAKSFMAIFLNSNQANAKRKILNCSVE